VRGAYVEFNFVHGEIQPTFWWIVRFTPGELTYPELYRRVATADFVAPLVDNFYIATHRYVETKHTGSIGVGLGGAAVPVLNDAHAAALGIDIGPRYRLDDLASALLAAVEWEDVVETRARVACLRDESLAASAAAFGAWLERVT